MDDPGERVREAEAERDRARAEAQELAYVLSHDLGEPLRMVRSYLQLLERRLGDRLDEREREFLFYAVDGAERGQRMLDDLLRYSRLSSRGEAFGEVDLDEVLDVALRAVRADVEAAGATVELRPPLGRVVGDRGQLETLFAELVRNAVSYGRPGRPPRVVVRRDGAAVLVEDDGQGIDERHHERIFRVFQRLHGREDGFGGGSGIGLALVRRIAERHGGRVWVQSVPGDGSVFNVELGAAGS